MEQYQIKSTNQKKYDSQQIKSNQFDVDQNIDEPPLQTLTRQLIAIGIKLRYIILLLPKHKQQATNQLKNWDMWGPLAICLIFSVSLSLASNQGIQNFVNVFLIYWIGGVIISVNNKLLGSKASLFQSLSSVGYCLFPLSLLGLLVSALHKFLPIWVKLILIVIGLFWSVSACIIINSMLLDPQKKIMSSYPVFLFYIFLAWYSIVI